MKAVSWNCRGLGGENKVESIRNILKSGRPDILLLQETKMSDVEVLRTHITFVQVARVSLLAPEGP